ncbi:MAG TPA: hypothetical protein VGR62_14840 [Candidatus Binatia bacterium]|nr:hypothetical protein [Candidatus Binatia bacterium]
MTSFSPSAYLHRVGFPMRSTYLALAFALLLVGRSDAGGPGPEQRLQQVGICGTCNPRSDAHGRQRYVCADGDALPCFTSSGTCVAQLTLKVADTTDGADPAVPCPGGGSTAEISLELAVEAPGGSTVTVEAGPTGNCVAPWDQFACPDGTANTFLCSRTQRRLTESVVPSFVPSDLTFQRFAVEPLGQQLREACGIPVGTPMVMAVSAVTKTAHAGDPQPSVLHACVKLYFEAIP